MYCYMYVCVCVFFLTLFEIAICFATYGYY